MKSVTIIGRAICMLIAASITLYAFAVPVCAADEKLPSGISVSKVDKEIASLAEGKKYASWSAVIFGKDEIIYSGSGGYVDKEKKITPDENTVYEWGSISKTMIWVSAMQLWEKGKLDLEKDIREYLPEGFLKKLRYDDPITMIDLMNHKGGWQPTLYTIQTKNESEIMSLGDALQYSEPVQIFRPGEVSAYSNWSAALAGYVIECISGISYGEYLHKNILEPLEMNHTSVMPDYKDTQWVREQREKLKSYQISEDSDEVTEKSLGTNMTFINIYPAGSVTGTIGDLTKYGQALLKGTLFQKSDTAKQMFQATDFYDNGKTPAMSHGFFNRSYNVETVGHSGGTDACSANFELDLSSEIGMAVMTNQFMESVFCDGITKIVFGSEKSAESQQLSRNEDITGHYMASSVYYAGPMRFISAFSPVIAKKGDDGKFLINGVHTNQVGDNLFQLEEEGAYQLIGLKETSDGRKILHTGGIDYVETHDDELNLVMIDAYSLMMIVSIGALIIKLFFLLLGKDRSYAGSKMITVSHFARVTSVAAIVVLFSILEGSMALTHIEATVIAIVQMICMGVYATAIVFSLISAIAPKENKGNVIYYVLSVLANGFGIVFLLMFDLCCFWL